MNDQPISPGAELFDTRDAFRLLAQDGIDQHAQLARVLDRRAADAAQSALPFPTDEKPAP